MDVQMSVASDGQLGLAKSAGCDLVRKVATSSYAVEMEI